MLTLHHLTQSRSFRILWLLEELKAMYGLQYQLITHTRNRHHLAPDELLQIHPMGKAPILVDDSRAEDEQTLAESAVIVEYLLKYYDKNQNFSPSDNFKSWRDYHFWLHFAESSLMPPLVMGLILSKAIEKSPFFARPIIRQVKAGADKMLLQGNIEKSLHLLNTHLHGKTWLVDEKITGADIQLYLAVIGAKKSGTNFEHFSHIQDWLNRCEQREAFKQAVILGGQPL